MLRDPFADATEIGLRDQTADAWRRCLAVHEASHCVLANFAGGMVEAVTISDDGCGRSGFVRLTAGTMGRATPEMLGCFALAGPVGEHLAHEQLKREGKGGTLFLRGDIGVPAGDDRVLLGQALDLISGDADRASAEGSLRAATAEILLSEWDEVQRLADALEDAPHGSLGKHDLFAAGLAQPRTMDAKAYARFPALSSFSRRLVEDRVGTADDEDDEDAAAVVLAFSPRGPGHPPAGILPPAEARALIGRAFDAGLLRPGTVLGIALTRECAASLRARLPMGTRR